MIELLKYLLYLLFGLIATGIVLFIHELGHFFMARALGAEVEVLGFGLGPVIWRHWGKNTEFRISLVPFGGYCRIGGSEDLSLALSNKNKRIKTAEKGSYFALSPFRKFLIFLSGPLTNLFLAILLLTIVSALPVKRISHSLYVAPSSDYETLFHSNITQESIKKGDKIYSSGDKVFIDWEDFTSFLKEQNGSEVTITLLRDGSLLDVVIYPFETESGWSYGIANLEEPVIGKSESPLFKVGDRIIKSNGNDIEWTYDLYMIEGDIYDLTVENEDGIRNVRIEGSSFPFAWQTEYRVSPDSSSPFSTAIDKTITLSKKTAAALLKLLSFQFSEALQVISGPFTSAHTIGKISTLAFSESTNSGIRTLLYLLAIVSISLCIGNLIPVPTFDGGQMLITVFEMITRRPLKPNTYLILHISGMALAWGLIIIMNAWGFVEMFLL